MPHPFPSSFPASLSPLPLTHVAVGRHRQLFTCIAVVNSLSSQYRNISISYMLVKKTRPCPWSQRPDIDGVKKERRVRVKAHLELIGRSERDWSQFPCVNQNRCFWASPWTCHKQAQLGLSRARGMRQIWFVQRRARSTRPSPGKSAIRALIAAYLHQRTSRTAEAATADAY
jgi:hypothetical protein